MPPLPPRAYLPFLPAMGTGHLHYLLPGMITAVTVSTTADSAFSLPATCLQVGQVQDGQILPAVH